MMLTNDFWFMMITTFYWCWRIFHFFFKGLCITWWVPMCDLYKRMCFEITRVLRSFNYYETTLLGNRKLPCVLRAQCILRSNLVADRDRRANDAYERFVTHRDYKPFLITLAQYSLHNTRPWTSLYGKTYVPLPGDLGAIENRTGKQSLLFVLIIKGWKLNIVWDRGKSGAYVIENRSDFSPLSDLRSSTFIRNLQ